MLFLEKEQGVVVVGNKPQPAVVVDQFGEKRLEGKIATIKSAEEYEQERLLQLPDGTVIMAGAHVPSTPDKIFLCRQSPEVVELAKAAPYSAEASHYLQMVQSTDRPIMVRDYTCEKEKQAKELKKQFNTSTAAGISAYQLALIDLSATFKPEAPWPPVSVTMAKSQSELCHAITAATDTDGVAGAAASTQAVTWWSKLWAFGKKLIG